MQCGSKKQGHRHLIQINPLAMPADILVFARPACVCLLEVLLSTLGSSSPSVF
jgi:hypothetical protein